MRKGAAAAAARRRLSSPSSLRRGRRSTAAANMTVTARACAADELDTSLLPEILLDEHSGLRDTESESN